MLLFYAVSSLLATVTVTRELFSWFDFVCLKRETVTSMSLRIHLTELSMSIFKGERKRLQE